MKTVKLCHLYYDIMNLYGENGNIRALESHLKNANVKCEIHFLTINDNIDFEKFDFYYIGMGSEENLFMVLNDIMKYKSDIKESINKNKFFLITGNALELFGEYIENLNGEKTKALNIFDYYSKAIDFRIVGEQVYDTSLINYPIIGFQNRSSIIRNGQNNLFNVKNGTGYEPSSTKEGIVYNNFYGTYLLGPVLIRNPHFTDYIVKNLLKSKKMDYCPKSNTLEYKAYDEFLNLFISK